ncbi:histidine kinase [Paenibacillus sp. HB172176]|uniref:sensor histidine kinase n=1 Tax=Paenibacillus sp. HB172176 TaxID=2493690 RepID=UPI00143C0FC4|nr:histidine kinase [Paenibacillus sp. HB172176]
MKIGSLYDQFIRNNTFMKMILTFTVITTVTIVTFSYFMFDFMSRSIVHNELENQKKAMDDVAGYMDRKVENVQTMMLDVYRNEPMSQQLAFFLQNPFDEYMKYMLDQNLSELDIDIPQGLDYFKNKLKNDPAITNLVLYSSDQQFLFVFNQNLASKLISVNVSKSYVPDSIALETNLVSTPNIWVRHAIGQLDEKLYAVRIPINDKQTLKNIGQLLVYFNSERIQKELESQKEQLKGYILVLGPTGEVLFDSSDRYYGERYPYADRIDTLYGTADLEEDSYVTTLTKNKEGYVIVGVAPKSEIKAAYQGLKRSIILISAFAILIVLLVPTFVVVNFAKRTNKIIRFMRKVETGDLTARITDEREDELGQISRSFNDMLDELTRHIDSVYKAEIKQKHTELSSLQARVNPHFLYNTLEVIRMRAISQGARDVGEMIYSLSMLFKSFVQPRGINTVKDELEIARLYLELFRIRYKDKLSYAIESNERLSGKMMMRIALQPIIENYVIHGLDSGRHDNHIRIAVTELNGRIRIEVRDNGKGISPDKLRDIRQSLSEPEQNGESFGLRSVDERLKLLYGSSFGLKIDSEEGAWTSVTLEFPENAGEVEHV